MVHFEDENIGKKVRGSVERLIESGKNILGKIRIDFVPAEVLSDYDEYEEFIREHQDADFYMVSEIVVGDWSQPLTMAAEEY